MKICYFFNLNWLQYTEMSTGKDVAVTIEGDANNVDSATSVENFPEVSVGQERAVTITGDTNNVDSETPDEKTKEKGMNRAQF